MSNIFEKMKATDCEELHFRFDPRTGLRSIIAIHSTHRGSVTSGGVRMMNYKNEDEALEDVLNLARAMTYKCAAINADLGGSKAVIWNSREEKNPALLKSFATFVNHLGGRYRTAVDYGLSHEDGRIIKSICPYIEGESDNNDGFDSEADTTALGVLKAMKIGWGYLAGNDSLAGVTVAVQGLGYVGRFLLEFLLKENAGVIGADIDQQIVEAVRNQYPQVTLVSPEQLLFESCDVLAPCAVGGILNEETIPRLKCKMICGAANNQLLTPQTDIQRLEKAKILYLPDFIVNAGGIIQAVVEMGKGTKEEALQGTSIIEENIRFILRHHSQSRRNTLDIANELVWQRLKEY